MNIPESIARFVSKQDEALKKRVDYNANDLTGLVSTLLNKGCVEVGWRECCGKTDFTMHVYRAWLKVVSRLRKDGVVIQEERQKHGNKYATNNGGFWNSIVYSIKATGEQS